MCEVFGISRQAYHKRLKQANKKEAIRTKLLNLINPIRKIMPRIGIHKLFTMLSKQFQIHNLKIGRDKFYNFMRTENLLVLKKKKYIRTTDSMHRFKKHKNLLKDTVVTRPEQVWVSDITYIRVNEKYEYLSLITDYYSKRIVGYNLSDNMKAESSVKALEMALKSRKYPNRELIHHSDRGFQYCCDEYTNILTNQNIKISMTEVYDPYENAVAERVNGILKDEFGIDEGFLNHEISAKEIKHSIDTYNNLRPHYSCNMLTPNQAHEKGKYKLKYWGRKNRINNTKNARRYSDNFLTLKRSKKIIGNNVSKTISKQK